MDDRHVRVHAPQQARSRETERAISDALAALLREKPFADVSVAEIAARANVSIGGFYARFPSKEALLELVELGILEEFRASAERDLAAEPLEGKGVGAVARAYTRMCITHFRHHRAEILQILRFTRPNSSTEARLRAFNVAVHDIMRALLIARRSEIVGADPMVTINLGLFFASALCREAVLTRNLQVYPVEVDDETLIEEIGAAFSNYLTGTRERG
jgi:AcrR family transcriptional regulator